ncbi:NAD(P)-dependent malic enzyme [Facklamia hominis]|uniref:NAD(P)-dependent malic enzyme n=1 Tax=Facklamia hominis TaxID=178214 RepID=UPI00101B7615|nr:NADP-dependent malic enzyme [Facklamia hominis]RYC98105.1 NADP-dependent malic enzyme [Facklamia hominis]
MDLFEESLKRHYDLQGKIEVVSRASIESMEDLALAYSPGVAQPCRVIDQDPDQSYALTRRQHLVAVVTNGTAVLGLGNIGPLAAMPVMEGKCALFKRFADVDAFPICVDSEDVDEVVDTIARISKSFGGINLEDIAAPACFEIEEKLKERCDVPVFHDDQHGTAIVVAAALLNAVKLTHKTMGQLKLVINGAGAAGIAIAKLLLQMGFGQIIMVDRQGILNREDTHLDPAKQAIAQVTNPEGLTGDLSVAIKGADVFIGVSAPKVVSQAMIRSMNDQAIVFAMANPVPEIMPEDALEAGAAIVGTGRSDYPNQINNVLAFPGIFKGVLAVRAREVTDGMKESAARAIASLIPEEDLKAEAIIVNALDDRVADVVAKAVADQAIKEGVSRH